MIKLRDFPYITWASPSNWEQRWHQENIHTHSFLIFYIPNDQKSQRRYQILRLPKFQVLIYITVKLLHGYEGYIIDDYFKNTYLVQT